jgi:hypothetical protein
MGWRVENRTFQVFPNNNGNAGMVYNGVWRLDILNGYVPVPYDGTNWETARYYMGGGYVPDISKIETQMWFFYRAVMYMTIGYESIHFGQIDLMSFKDANHVILTNLTNRIRRVAAEGLPDGTFQPDGSPNYKKVRLELHTESTPPTTPPTFTLNDTIEIPITGSRRKWILLDAHSKDYHEPGTDKLIFNFNSFPVSFQTAEQYPHVSLDLSYRDADFGIVRRGDGSETYFGWACEHLPYLLEIDNYGSSNWQTMNERNVWFPWGYDQITWWGYALTKQQRDEYIRYFHYRLRFLDSNGFFQVPVVRDLALPYIKGDIVPKTYFAHAKFSRNYAHGNQEDVITQFMKHEIVNWYLDRPFVGWYEPQGSQFLVNTVAEQIFYVSKNHRLCNLGHINDAWYVGAVDWSFPDDVGDSITLNKTEGVFYKGLDDKLLHCCYWQNGGWHHQAAITDNVITGKICSSTTGQCFYKSENRVYMTHWNGVQYQTDIIYAEYPTAYINEGILLFYADNQNFLVYRKFDLNLVVCKNTSTANGWPVEIASNLGNATTEVIVAQDGHIYYMGTDNHLYECVFTGVIWETNVVDGRNLANVAGYLRQVLIYNEMGNILNNDLIYLGTDHRLWRAFETETGWHRDALNWSAPANVVDNVVIDSFGKIFYRGTDSRIHSFEWQPDYQKWHYEAILDWRTEPANGISVTDLQTNNVADHLLINRIAGEVFYTDHKGRFCRIIQSNGYNFNA